MVKQWFTDWFNSAYYHILYKDRDYQEAESFIAHLVATLKMEADSAVADLACGKGRHSIYLNKLGYKVTGIDLAVESIAFASNFENPTLHFLVQDMRQSLGLNKYNYILNLFTSFGYFDTEAENIDTIVNIKNALMPSGKFVIDYLNANKVIAHLVGHDTKTIEGVNFNLHRKVEGGKIIKNIDFTANGQDFHFTEKVAALTLEDFTKYFKKADLVIVGVYGNYNLDTFDVSTSDRLIIVAQKTV